MDIGTYLRQATATLQQAGILTARLDVLVLLEDLLNKDRSLLLAHTDDILSANQLISLQRLIGRRRNHEPLAYIRGHAAFYGRDFKVTQDVLVPRPETEAFIEVLKELVIPPSWSIADIGTGSGAIGLTAALELPLAQVDLYDISSDALAVASDNLRVLQPTTPVDFYQSDLLSNLQQSYDVLLANLPYVPTDYSINKAAGFEPALALFSGDDGLDDYRTFWQQVNQLKYKPTYIITEALPTQHARLDSIAKAAGYSLQKTDDFIQLFAKSN